MNIVPNTLKEIFSSLEHGEVSGIAKQLGGNYTRLRVRQELTTLKDDYDPEIIHAAINRLKARGVEINLENA
jgi:hypothetical protein